MIMNDPKDPFYVSRKKVFLWGLIATSIICALVFLYVPGQPMQKGNVKTLEQALPVENSSSNAPAVSVIPPAESYAKFCSQCHGKEGLADTTFADMMSVKPSNLVKGPFKFDRSKDTLKSLIMTGTGPMPGFAKELGEKNAEALVEYVLQLEKPKGE